LAVGPGAGDLAALIDGRDPVCGPYVDNTDVFTVMQAQLLSRQYDGAKEHALPMSTNNAPEAGLH